MRKPTMDKNQKADRETWWWLISTIHRPTVKIDLLKILCFGVLTNFGFPIVCWVWIRTDIEQILNKLLGSMVHNGNITTTCKIEIASYFVWRRHIPFFHAVDESSIVKDGGTFLNQYIRGLFIATNTSNTSVTDALHNQLFVNLRLKQSRSTSGT